MLFYVSAKRINMPYFCNNLVTITTNALSSVCFIIYDIYFYYINTNEIPGELLHENIPSHVKITCYLHMWKDHCCYGYKINCVFHSKKLLKWNGLVFHWHLYNLYYYMRNFCILIGLEQWYFSLIWNIPACENYKPFGGSCMNKW